MICFTLASIGDLIHMIIKYQNFPYRLTGDIRENIAIATKDIFYFAGNVAFYVLILLRSALPFELNKYISYSLISLIILFGISSIVYTVSLFFVNDDQLEYILAVAPLTLEDVILSPFILIIFVHKMRQTVINIDPSLSKEAERNVNLMRNVMIKHAILFGVAILVNQLFYAADIRAHFHFTVWTSYCLSYMARAIETVVNVLVLWLILRVNYGKYIGLCKCCHICCGKCCFKNVDSMTVSSNPYKQLGDQL